jgi:moderate conductance mechanosensitive channel
MIRYTLSLLLLVLLATGQADAATPPRPPPAPQLSAAQAEQALEVLRDPARREQVMSVLEALAKVAPAAPAPGAAPATPAPLAAATPAATPQPAPPATTAPQMVIPLAPNSIGAQILVEASHRLSTLSGDIVTTARGLMDFPLLWHFLVYVAMDPWSQGQILDVSWKLVVVMLGGIGVQWLVIRLLARPQRLLHAAASEITASESTDDTQFADPEAFSEDDAPQVPGAGQPSRRRLSFLAVLRRLPLVIARLVLELLPVVALLGVGYALLSTALGSDTISRLVILGVLHAYALCRVASSISRVLLGPGLPRLILVPDATGQYALRWVRRISAVAIFGYAFAEIGLLFGLYLLAHDAVLHLVGLTVHLCLAIVVLQNRATVARWIRARPGVSGPVALLRNRLAGLWHYVAIFYVMALWVVSALDVPDGYTRLLRLFVATSAILIIARLLVVGALGMLERATRLPPDMAERYPGLQARVGTYHPVARACIQCLGSAATVVALFEVWGLNSIAWFTEGALGGRLADALVTIGLTVVLALLVWEAANAAIHRHLSKLSRETQLGRSARLRTLLPMLRTALLITICMVAGLMILSQIGVNIAPLLAGAGVLGIAIGFGSQKLVQDIITGLFLLLENTMQVGDVVSLGGLSGVVENLSIRTIRLRAEDGSVHIVPFSAVTTVTNMTRDFGYAVLNVVVGVNEEPDHISDVLNEVARTMRTEPRWATAIRDDLEVMGVDKFTSAGWVWRARVKTTPSQRWAVGRELNRRIKYRFDELAIESQFTSYRALGQTRPAFIQITGDTV